MSFSCLWAVSWDELNWLEITVRNNICIVFLRVSRGKWSRATNMQETFKINDLLTKYNGKWAKRHSFVLLYTSDCTQGLTHATHMAVHSLWHCRHLQFIAKRSHRHWDPLPVPWRQWTKAASESMAVDLWTIKQDTQYLLKHVTHLP